MMDVGILCREPRFGINTEKGRVSLSMQAAFIPVVPECVNSAVFIYLALSVLCYVFLIPDCSITKFLNRILGLEVHKQNHLFQYFTDNFDYLIEKDKKEGKYDMGILGMEHQLYKTVLNSLYQ